MQKLIIPALISFMSLLCFTACDKSNDNTPDNAPVWVITYFEVDKTPAGGSAAFNGYTFDFNPDNSFTVHVPGGSTLTGKWSLETNDTQFVIDISDPVSPVDILIGKWNVEEYTDTSIKLKNEPGTIPNAWANQGLRVHFVKQ